MRNILGERSVAILVPLLAFPPVLWTIGLGQNGFLTAGLFGAATLLIDRRPTVAGLLFGALCVKPHFALLVPVALAAGGRWRAFAAAFACAAALCLLSLAVFGWQTWHAFLTAMMGSQAVYASGRIPFGGFVTPFGAAMLLGATRTLAGIVQAGAAVLAAGLVAWVWRRGLSLPLRAASAVSATLVAVPLALFYDLVLAGIAGAWLLRSDGKYRLREWEKAALAGLYVLSLNPRGIAANWHLPVGPLIAATFVTLVATVALRDKLAARTFAIGGPAPRQPDAVAGS
jgi:alpha-1,2-mannosyltransferase